MFEIGMSDASIRWYGRVAQWIVTIINSAGTVTELLYRVGVRLAHSASFSERTCRVAA